MKLSIKIIALLGIFLLSACGITRKVEKSEQKEKTTEITSEKSRDSSSYTTRTLGSESELRYNLNSLGEMADFLQRVSTGGGSESTVEKKGSEIIIRNILPETTEKETKVNQRENTEVYTSEYIVNETLKVIKRLPWWVYVIGAVVVLYWLLKILSPFLIILFPGLAAFRIFKIFS